MDKSNKRGKIPQQDWPLIMARYDAGETLASIARTYDCSPPAISYVVSRSRARSSNIGAAAVTRGPTDPQLVKAGGLDAREPAKDAVPPGSLVKTEMTVPVPSAPPQASRQELFRATVASNGTTPEPIRASDSRFESQGEHARRGGNGPDLRSRQHENGSVGPIAHNPIHGVPNTAPSSNGGWSSPEARRRLHLSHAGGGATNDGPAPLAGGALDAGRARAAPPPPPAASREFASEQPGHPSHPAYSGVSPNMVIPSQDGPKPKEGSSFIDQRLRERVDADIAVFLAAFDAALARDTQESRTELREATDRLLRAGARTRIELERLEARVPLPARNAAGHEQRAWAPR